MRLSNGIIFQNRQEDKYSTEKIIAEIDECANQHTAPDAIILEEDRLKGMYKSTLWYGFEGTNVREFFSEWEDVRRELEKNQPKESITKEYEPLGMMVTMSKNYGSYQFSEEELDKLYKGDTIEINFTSQWGNTKHIKGRLDRRTWDDKNIVFWAFVTEDLQSPEENIVTGIYQGQKIRFKNQFGTHKLTEDEIKRLLNGESIYVVITNNPIISN